jgi:S-adenosylmethionine synthetase
MYEECSAYGWFGRTNKVVHKKFTDSDGNVKEMDVELFTWEKLDAVDKIKKAFNLS